MHKTIKNFTLGKCVLKVNNKDEFDLLISFIKKNNIMRTAVTGGFPKYFYMKYKKLIEISDDDILLFHNNEITFTNFIKRIGFLNIEFETSRELPCINMRTYIEVFIMELRKVKISFWKRIIDRLTNKNFLTNPDKAIEDNATYVYNKIIQLKDRKVK
jgi:hypothetical protein